MVIQLEDKVEIERLISILNIGLCVAIARGALSVEEAENYLYSPYTMQKLKTLGVSQALIDTIHLGTELENVERLVPESFSDSLNEIQEKAIEILRSLPPTALPRDKWVQSIAANGQTDLETNGKPNLMHSTEVYAMTRK